MFIIRLCPLSNEVLKYLSSQKDKNKNSNLLSQEEYNQMINKEPNFQHMDRERQITNFRRNVLEAN